MNRYGEYTPRLFPRNTDGFVRKQHRAIRRSLVPQTSLIFRLPDELILSILSHISPDPHLTGDYARYSVQYCMKIGDGHQQRMKFLRPLSRTCRAMRLRLLPWIWNHIQASQASYDSDGIRMISWKFIAIAQTVYTDMSLATRIKFMTVHFLGDQAIRSFVQCLELLPNLHTLEIGSSGNGPDAALLKTALRRVRLSQIKTLIIPESAHPLLEHCPSVEDVVWVITDKSVTSNEFLRSLTSNRFSKVKRLAVPLALPSNPSRYVEACRRLTELTVFYPHPYPREHPHDIMGVRMGTSLDTVGTTHSVLLELINACNTLPDFDTLQIVHLSLATPPPISRCWRCNGTGSYTERRRQAVRDRVQGAKDLAIECLKSKPRRKRTTLRVIELGSILALPRPSPAILPWSSANDPLRFNLGSVMVEEYGV